MIFYLSLVDNRVLGEREDSSASSYVDRAIITNSINRAKLRGARTVPIHALDVRSLFSFSPPAPQTPSPPRFTRRKSYTRSTTNRERSHRSGSFREFQSSSTTPRNFQIRDVARDPISNTIDAILRARSFTVENETIHGPTPL